MYVFCVHIYHVLLFEIDIKVVGVQFGFAAAK